MTSEKEKQPPTPPTMAVQVADWAASKQAEIEQAASKIKTPYVFDDECGHKYLMYDGQQRKIDEIRPLLKNVTLHTVAGFVNFVSKYGGPTRTNIQVNTDGVEATLNHDAMSDLVERVKLPFFQADLPPSHKMGAEDFLDWLDCSAVYVECGAITMKGATELEPVAFVPTLKGDAARDAFKKLSIYNVQRASIHEKGALINVVAENSAKGETTVEVPRFLKARLPIGTHEYTEDFIFKLTIRTDDGAMTFQLKHVGRDRAIYRAIRRIASDIENALGDDWLVVE